ncbi:Uncharacterised protein [Raoultella terrigena]|uniref:Uncharacterized protein n=1 Tax=Raoultella terrigena TaxID=577 RepID=A0A3P8IRP1_RAOTE|nr:Uncharacterised protein [Raoultella terrigena]
MRGRFSAWSASPDPGRARWGAIVVGLDRPDGGTLTLAGQPWREPGSHHPERPRGADGVSGSYSSLNPRRRVDDTLAQPLQLTALPRTRPAAVAAGAKGGYRRSAGAGGAARFSGLALPVAAVRRPAPAGGYCPCTGDEPEAYRRRRGGIGAGYHHPAPASFSCLPDCVAAMACRFCLFRTTSMRWQRCATAYWYCRQGTYRTGQHRADLPAAPARMDAPAACGHSRYRPSF